MRAIDADELMEHVYRDKLDSRELIAKMVEDAPTIQGDFVSMRTMLDYYEQENRCLKNQIKALVFAIRCNGVSGNEVVYEDD